MQGHKGRKYNLCQRTERQKCHEKPRREMERKTLELSGKITSVEPNLKPLRRLD